MMVLLVHSKSNALPSASRTRGSLNLSRRVLRNQPCAPDGVSSGSSLALDAAILHRRKIVARIPYPRGELLAEQIAAAGKAFEGDVAVAVEFETHRIEIIAAAADRQIGAPPILDPLEFDEAIDLEFRRPCMARCRAEYRASIPRTGGSRNRPCEKIGRPATNSGTSRPRLSAKLTTSVASSTASAFSMSRTCWVMIGWPLGLQRVQRERGVVGRQFRAVVKLASGRSVKR